MFYKKGSKLLHFDLYFQVEIIQRALAIPESSQTTTYLGLALN